MRLTPQASGTSFAGQDNRLNNITVDGSYFNNAFGLGSAPGERTNVAPISLESLEQVQVSIAPFDVRQGSFIGAAINSVTRSGTNQFSASVYHRMRDQDLVGTEARGQTVNPGTFTFRDTGVWASGPIVRNKLFAFGNYENEEDKRPLHTNRANLGGEAVVGSVSRVLASDLNALSSFLSQNFQYETGGYENFEDLTPAKRYLLRSDFNLTNANKISFRYNQLDSSSANNLSTSSSAGIGRTLGGSGGLHFAASNYTILENIKSGIGEWNTVIGNSMSNNLIVGLTSNDESRGAVDKLFPFVDILEGGTSYMSFGTEPFTVNNELRYKTFQLQDSFTKYGTKHTMTFGATTQRYESENVFWSCCPQSNYTYNSLADFYADANDFLAQSEQDDVAGDAAQVQGALLERARSRKAGAAAAGLVQRRVCAGRMASAPRLDGHGWHPDGRLGVQEHGLPECKADALTFRDEDGSPVQYRDRQDARFENSLVAACGGELGRRGPRPHAGAHGHRPLHRPAALRVDLEPARQHGRAHRRDYRRQHDGVPVQHEPRQVQAGDRHRRRRDQLRAERDRPQLQVPAGVAHEPGRRPSPAGRHHGHGRVPLQQGHQRRVLHQRQPAGGADDLQRRRRAAALDGQPHQQHDGQRHHERVRPEEPGHRFVVEPVGQPVENAVAWPLAARRVQLWRGEEHDRSGLNSLVDLRQQPDRQRSEQPGTRILGYTQGHRVFLQASYSKQYFGFGATTISAFWEAKPSFQNFATTGATCSTAT